MRGMLICLTLLVFLLPAVAYAAAEPGVTPKVDPRAVERFAFIRWAAGLACVILMAIIVELVRRRMLRIEYSWLWFLTAAAMLVLAIWYDLLIVITRVIFLKAAGDQVEPRQTLFLFGLLFLLSICLYYSVKISQLTDQVKTLTQSLSLHKAGADEKSDEPSPSSGAETRNA